MGTGNAVYGLNSGIFNNKLYFSAGDGTDEAAMWVTDGTSGGTTLVKVFNTTGSSGVSGFVEVNGKLMMTANDGIYGFELWVSDGTAQNTLLLKDINIGAASSSYAIYPNKSTCGNVLFFDADNGNNNTEPWVTDGTAAGTYLIKDIHPTENSLDYETRYVQVGSKIYFSARLPTGRQLFAMDATCTLGVMQNQRTEIKIYPNPASDFININSETAIEKVEIYNVAGQLILNAAGSKTQIDVRKLKGGVYVMKITGKDQSVISKKLIIK